MEPAAHGAGTDRQRAAGIPGCGADSRHRLRAGAAGSALGGRPAQAGRFQPDGGGGGTGRSRHPDRLPAGSGEGSGQAGVLAGDAGSDPAGEHGAGTREHQPDVRHDAGVHSDAHRRDRDRDPGDDSG